MEENETMQGRPIEKATIQEVQDAIKRLNSRKVPDTNGISTEHIKTARSELSPVITELINGIFNKRDVTMKRGILTKVKKKGKDKVHTEN